MIEQLHSKIEHLEPIVNSVACFTLEIMVFYIFYTLSFVYVRIAIGFIFLALIGCMFKIDIPDINNLPEHFIFKRHTRIRPTTDESV